MTAAEQCFLDHACESTCKRVSMFDSPELEAIVAGFAEDTQSYTGTTVDDAVVEGADAFLAAVCDY